MLQQDLQLLVLSHGRRPAWAGCVARGHLGVKADYIGRSAVVIHLTAVGLRFKRPGGVQFQTALASILGKENKVVLLVIGETRIIRCEGLFLAGPHGVVRHLRIHSGKGAAGAGNVDRHFTLLMSVRQHVQFLRVRSTSYIQSSHRSFAALCEN